MSKKLVSLFLALLIVFSMTASLAEGSGITVTDMYGREVTLTEPATRIVVMQPSDCEIPAPSGAKTPSSAAGSMLIILLPSWKCRSSSPVRTPTSKRSWRSTPRWS